MTVDVESFSIPLNSCDDETGTLVHDQGLPDLISLFSKHDIEGTFFFTGLMAERFPDSVQLVLDHGHEIGCHGYDHAHGKAFDLLNLEEQVQELMKARNIITERAGQISSFRAPALRMNEDTVLALEKTGFSIDSSICSQRFDGPFTFGSKRKLSWLSAPRTPYFLSHKSVYQKGHSRILEIPVSSFILSFSGTSMRRVPRINRMLQAFLLAENRLNGKPLNFLIHPNECIESGQAIKPTRRTNNYVEHLFADIIRQRLKMKNLGGRCLVLLDEMLSELPKKDLEFSSLSRYAKTIRNSNGN